jgi:signal transduction histidine kinase
MVKAIIRNLIDNAVKNTENGTITIDVTHEKDTNTCQIMIADEGKGLDEKLLHELNAISSRSKKSCHSRPRSSGIK